MGSISWLTNKLKVLLERVTLARARAIDATKHPRWARPRWLTHLLTPTAVLFIVFETFVKTRELNFFSLHPICMSLAFVMLMPQGIVSYRNTMLLDVFSPIMQHGTKFKKRNIHITMQLMMVAFAALGLAFILVNKAIKGKPLLPHTPHALLGTVVLLSVVMQAIVGQRKYTSLSSGVIDARNRRSRYRWHGKMGLLIFDGAGLSVILGLLSFLGLSWASLLPSVIVGYLWLNINLQMHDSKHITTQIYRKDGGGDEDREAATEVEKLTDEGVPETKGQEYPV